MLDKNNIFQFLLLSKNFSSHLAENEIKISLIPGLCAPVTVFEYDIYEYLLETHFPLYVFPVNKI